MDFYRINEEYNQYLQRGDEKEIKGSLRFNYMIPVPEECIERLVIKDVEDEKYRLLLNKEYQFCMDNAERIQKKANKIYEMVITNRKQKLTDNSCSFSILEQGYQEYVENVLKDYYTRHMADGTFVSWLALDGKNIIGTSGMSFVEKLPYFGCPNVKIGLLSSMFTEPQYRRKGIAKEFLYKI